MGRTVTSLELEVGATSSVLSPQRGQGENVDEQCPEALDPAELGKHYHHGRLREGHHVLGTNSGLRLP